MKKLTKKQIKNRELLREWSVKCLTDPLKSREQMTKEYEERQRQFKKAYGW